MNVSPQDYSREERRRSSWRGSRGKNRFSQSTALRQGRRLTLIDLLLLAVMAAILVPWAIQRSNIEKLGPYRARLEQSDSGEERVLLLSISLPEGSHTQDEDVVGWQLFNETGELVHEEYDIAPKPGNFREFVVNLDFVASYLCILKAGSYDQEIKIQPVAD